MFKGMHSTFQSGTYYISVGKLPEDVQKIIVNAIPELECSRYTVYENSGFLRGQLELDGVKYSFEVGLGSCDIQHSDYKWSDELQAYVDDKGREVDGDLYAEDFLRELYAITEIENLDVYLTLTEEN